MVKLKPLQFKEVKLQPSIFLLENGQEMFITAKLTSVAVTLEDDGSYVVDEIGMKKYSFSGAFQITAPPPSKVEGVKAK